jgi:hypothetical protein
MKRSDQEKKHKDENSSDKNQKVLGKRKLPAESKIDSKSSTKS